MPNDGASHEGAKSSVLASWQAVGCRFWIRSLPEISRLLIQIRIHAELRGSSPQALITCPEAGVGR